MRNLREAAQQALEALESGLLIPHSAEVFTALRAALVEPEERQTMTPKELAASLKRGEKWILIEENT